MSASARAPLVVRHRVGGYSAYEPSPDLAHAVENFWAYVLPGDFSRPGGAMHRVLPDPSVSIAFSCCRDAAGAPADARVILVGEKTRPTVVSYDRRREIAAVRIKIEWVQPLIGVRPNEHQDADVDLGCVLPALACDLLDRLARTRSAGGAIETLRTALVARRTDVAGLGHAVVTDALNLVRRSHGCCPVERIATRTGFSARHLRRLVDDAVGISLKSFARTTRFVAAIAAADGVDRPQWARIAADAGFYDQSHLVRECQDICGMTPVALFRERRAQVIAPARTPGITAA